MTRKILILILILGLIPSLLSANEPAQLNGEEKAAVSNINNVFRRAVEIVKPAVVTISTYENSSRTGLGSGFIIDETGYIVTNNHVAADNDTISVLLTDNRTFEVTDVYLDEYTDLAVLKIDTKGEKLPAVKFGNSDEAQVGDFVFAMGSPFGLTQTVTMGIISYKGRETKILGEWGIEDFIQTDAEINKGNSGGPLINLYGEVIGVNSNIFTPTGVSTGYGFAVPSNIANDVSKELIANQAVMRGYLGVKLFSNPVYEIKSFTDAQILELTNNKLDDANRLKNIIVNISDNQEGVFVMEVNPDTPAAEGKMEPFDIILSYNDKKPADSSELRRWIAMTKPDTVAKFTVLRENRTIELAVKLGDRDEAIAKIQLEQERLMARRNQYNQNPYQIIPQNPIPFSDQYQDSKPKLGVKIQQFTPFLAKQYGYPEIMGQLNHVVVTSVNIGSLAEQVGISEGDLILSVNGKKVSTPDQLKELIDNSDLRQGVQIKIKNNSGERNITVSTQDNAL